MAERSKLSPASLFARYYLFLFLSYFSSISNSEPLPVNAKPLGWLTMIAIPDSFWDKLTLFNLIPAATTLAFVAKGKISDDINLVQHALISAAVYKEVNLYPY